MGAINSDQLAAAIEAGERWAIHDPDPITRGQIDRLVDDQADELVDLFTGRLAFGTAGLRAAVGPGPQRMNRLVVRQTTTAVVRWLQHGTTAAQISMPTVLIGFDGRTDSARFAHDAAAAVVAAGGEVLLADAPAPTPICAHAMLAASADAAVVITASHNPASDNGYKLYLGDGLQLVSPSDTEIAAEIEAVSDRWHVFGSDISDAAVDIAPNQSVDDWAAAHRSDAVGASVAPYRDIQIAYTPLHGVAGAAIAAAFADAGFPPLHTVAAQFEPDGSFPTVAFPNPEEPGAFEAVVQRAIDTGADAAFANDPDGDRLAIAVLDPDSGAFVRLSGDELGVLLADHLLRNSSGPRQVARSVVSSRLLDVMARAADVACSVTLTGFKWVARPIVTQPALSYTFGYEQAIGYCVGSHVRDKDGITAALIAAELLAEAKAQGSTVWHRFDELARRHGVYQSDAVTIRFDDDPQRPSVIAARLRSHPPSVLGDQPVAQSGPIGLGDLPSSEGVQLVLADDSQIIVRPSGTEPKLKAYIELIEPVTSTVESARGAAHTRMQRLRGLTHELIS